FRHARPAPVDEYLKALVVIAYLWLLLFKVFGLYDFARARSRIDTVHLLVKAVSVGTLLVLSLGFFYRQFTFSRLVLIYGWAMSIALFTALRLAIDSVRTRRHRAGLEMSRVAVVGSRTLARFLIDKIAREPELGYRVCGVVDDGPPPSRLPAPYLGTIAELDRTIEELGLAGVLIAHPSLGHLDLLKVIEVCERRRVALRMVPPTYDLRVNYRDFEEVDGIPLVRINEQEVRRWSDFAKRVFDLAVAGAALVLLAPVLLLAAAAIRAEGGGPVFFTQKRAGKDGRRFRMFKLRTMVVGAEALLPELVDLGGLGEPVFKLEDDPRVTRVGRILRRTSLDELPQLLNVLRGEMSLVGPRPEEEAMVSRYNVWERRRLKAVPGITGLQQVQCRGTPSLKERVRWDIIYLRKQSLLLDAWILFKTVWVVVTGKGAR
ncbi:MAG: sugar transferase, partial [Thermoanaerobaculia bacterium]